MLVLVGIQFLLVMLLKIIYGTQNADQEEVQNTPRLTSIGKLDSILNGLTTYMLYISPDMNLFVYWLAQTQIFNTNYFYD